MTGSTGKATRAGYRVYVRSFVVVVHSRPRRAGDSLEAALEPVAVGRYPVKEASVGKTT